MLFDVFLMQLVRTIEHCEEETQNSFGLDALKSDGPGFGVLFVNHKPCRVCSKARIAARLSCLRSSKFTKSNGVTLGVDLMDLYLFLNTLVSYTSDSTLMCFYPRERRADPGPLY